jgi:hypothetical protein
MKAFDLEDQIFGKGMMRRVLESDPSDDTSLVNRLTDPRFEELHTAMGFVTAAGSVTPDFTDSAWVENIVDKYFDRIFINTNDAQNENVGTVLEFREKFSGITSWYQVLQDEKLTDFFQVSLGLPEEISALDVDVQKGLFENKFDLAKLADPAERQKLIDKYVAVSDILNPPSTGVNSSALSVIQSINLSGQFVPITLDVPSITYSASMLYK